MRLRPVIQCHVGLRLRRIKQNVGMSRSTAEDPNTSPPRSLSSIARLYGPQALALLARSHVAVILSLPLLGQKHHCKTYHLRTFLSTHLYVPCYLIVATLLYHLLCLLHVPPLSTTVRQRPPEIAFFDHLSSCYRLYLCLFQVSDLV